ncbi:unnamed protein product [Amoebophrya sp. A120]|nr:unnamed protein product [Amoebophrya sp. A120]|eukprot:GSA120T00020251001.1
MHVYHARAVSTRDAQRAPWNLLRHLRGAAHVGEDKLCSITASNGAMPLDASIATSLSRSANRTHLINCQGLGYFCNAVRDIDSGFEFYNVPFRWPATVLFRYGTQKDRWLPLVVKTSLQEGRPLRRSGDSEFRYRLGQIHEQIALPLILVAPTVQTFFTKNLVATEDPKRNLRLRESEGITSLTLVDQLRSHWKSSPAQSLHECFRGVMLDERLCATGNRELAIADALVLLDTVLYRPAGLKLSFPLPTGGTAHNALLNDFNVMHKIASSTPRFSGKKVKLSSYNEHKRHEESTQERPLTEQEVQALHFLCVVDLCPDSHDLLGLFMLPKAELSDCFLSSTDSEKKGRQTYIVYPPYAVPKVPRGQRSKWKADRHAFFYVDARKPDGPQKLLQILNGCKLSS